MGSYLLPEPIEVPPDFVAECGCSPRVAEVLWRRGIKSPERARALLYPREFVPSAPRDIPYMDEAVRVITDALSRGLSPCVFGDYDVDGIAATAILVETLRHIGYQPSFYLPDRFREGYGITPWAVERLAGEGVQLIITCDNGITAHEALERAKELGLTVVVTDHHTPGEVLPPAAATVNPKFLPDGHPARMLPGAVVAYLLARELAGACGKPLPAEMFLDLIALAIVADAVPLLGDNRHWLVKGLPALWSTCRPGLQALFSIAGVDPLSATEEDLAFQVIPRLNAAGRISNAMLALNLIISRVEGEARELAQELDRQNQIRKDFTAEIIAEALARVEEDAPAIVLYAPLWHEGVIGIAAGKLAEQFNKPAFLMTRKEDGRVTGSARAGSCINVYAALAQCRELLLGFGGHAEAAGFQLEEAKVRELKEALQDVVGKMLAGEPQKRLQVDLLLEPQELDLSLWQELRVLAPFGEGHPPPVCLTRDLAVLSQRSFGEDRHTRLVLERDDITLPATLWFNGGKIEKDRVDVIYNLGLDRFNGRETIYLNVIELVPTGVVPVPVLKSRSWLDRRVEKMTAGHIARLAGEFPTARIFGEGLEFRRIICKLPQEVQERVADRYTLSRTPVLIVATPPASALLMEEILALARPETVVLGFAPQQGSLQTFVKVLQGLLKFAMNRLGGRTSIRDLAVATGELEEAVEAGLKLIASATATPIHITGDTIYIFEAHPSTAKGKPEVKGLREKLKFLIEGSLSFRRYLAASDCRELETVFPG